MSLENRDIGGLMIAAIGVGPAEAVVVLLFWLIWPVIGGYVARQKRRSIAEGVLLGFLGPVGALIEALLPTKFSS